MRNTVEHPAQPDEVIRALMKQAEKLAAEDLEKMRFGNMDGYFLRVAADFIAQHPSLFRDFSSKNP